jgi:uncharacterized protein YggL (DUF469 family)
MKLDKIDNKSRRIRKKLFLGEFAILGFEISCETDINDFDRYDAFVDDFIDYIDGLGLCRFNRPSIVSKRARSHS